MKRNTVITAFIAILIILVLTTFIARHSVRKPDTQPSSGLVQKPALPDSGEPHIATTSATPTEIGQSSGHAGTPKPVHDSAELSDAITREASEAGHQREAYDQPGEAAEFYRLKRVPEGEKYVPVERYGPPRPFQPRATRVLNFQAKRLPPLSEPAWQQGHRTRRRCRCRPRWPERPSECATVAALNDSLRSFSSHHCRSIISFQPEPLPGLRL